MPPLADAQNSLRRALVYGEPLPSDLLSNEYPDAETRFDIHRNHFFRSLTTALQRTFPAVVSLVDQRFFAYCAHEFIQSAPPRAPCLFEYGETFSNFLAQFPPCRGLPYLADVAELEWKIHAVFHALDASAAEAGSSSHGGLPADVRLMESRYPIHLIWNAALDSESPPVDITAGSARLLVYRIDGESTMQELGAAAFEFLNAVAAGSGPLIALGRATLLDRDYSLGSEIPSVVMSGIYGIHSRRGGSHVR